MFDDVLIVIPARGGSKGIPQKNLQLLGGMPLFIHSVLAAVDTGISKDNILVSSDDLTTLDIAAHSGVVPHARPRQLCGPNASTELALLDAWKRRPDCKTVVTLQPTSPLRFGGLVKSCLKAYQNGDYDSLLTTTKIYDFFWYEKKTKQKYAWHSTYDPNNRPMRQSLTREQYKHFDNGNVYISDAKMLKETECRLGKKVCIFPISQAEGMQIDTPADLAIFNAMFEGLRQGCEIPISYETGEGNS